MDARRARRDDGCALGGEGSAVHFVGDIHQPLHAIEEARRINEELDQAKRVRVRVTDQENRPTLRRDPRSGEYRL